VFVKAKFFRITQPSKKLSEKFLGPFKILDKVGPQSFRLRLPDKFRSVHPTYHVSMLEPEQPSVIPDQTSTLPSPVEMNGKLKYKIDKIVDSKFDKQFCCLLRYKVKWLGYKDDTDAFTWQAANELDSA
jgi:hypothetical protein